MPFDYEGYNREYKKNHYDALHIRFQKGDKDYITEAAMLSKMSVNQWVTTVLLEAAKKIVNEKEQG